MLSKFCILAILFAIDTTRALPWTWQVHGYSSVCVAATCYYNFNVTGPGLTAQDPAFEGSYCSGSSTQTDYKPCSIITADIPSQVLTQTFNKGISVGAIVSVHYTFEYGGATYDYEGNATVKHTGMTGPLIDFPIEVTKAWTTSIAK